VLTLDSCSLEYSHCRIISEHLRRDSKIEKLSLTDCFFQESGGPLIFGALKQSTSITELSVTIPGLTLGMFQALAGSLSSNQSLIKLVLFHEGRGNAKLPLAVEGLGSIFLALQSNGTLQEFCVWYMHLWSEQVMDRFRALLESRQSGLVKLFIWGEGPVPLLLQVLPSLAVNSTLKELEFGCLVRQDDMLQLAPVLAKNHCLGENWEHTTVRLRM
jgi:hypothetical protein